MYVVKSDGVYTYDSRWVRRNGTKPSLSLIEQVVVAAVMTAILARLWRWW